MKETPRADYTLLTYFSILLVFGLVMLTSASAAVGHERFTDVYFFIKRQLLLGVLPGIFLFFFFSKFPYQKLRKFSLAFFVFSIILLILIFIPGIGSSYGTVNRSWLSIFGFSFQPAEFTKLALIIYLAALLVAKGKELLDFKKGFLTVLGIGGIPLILVALQPDIGTLAILFVIIFSLLFIAGAKWSHIISLASVGVLAFILLIAIAPYRLARLTTFLHPELDPQGIGYHINQAFLAIGSGGVFGRGYGNSVQKFQYLPEVAADSIYAVIAEEMGFVFALCLVVLLYLIAVRGFNLAKKSPDHFGKLLVSGIIIWFTAQSFLNIGAMVGILPITGVPLPFISHGGSALAISMGAVGILINVSKQVES
ncbi:MAG: Stage V sporulation protein E (Required for spore cortex synthesis) [Candidatus Magasanikbacteria bacterium GW2011_GWC2_37_14]|uniref:Probable peptidoglycan glycosyltransferase FtsW n=1 Tax=Candidatus Magasanikbacteria bacterium GW2011_GWC2_37_14 TaxID=1619046 RepID=A0A0G0ITB8_9BACT|nr:MAG: Stage V sporulation protein E (Required for spore cortex synthesis) [Candidatus Magasanikbacteria bacterium GW2011_GWC2_37_14]